MNESQIWTKENMAGKWSRGRDWIIDAHNAALEHEEEVRKPLVEALKSARSAMTNVLYNKPRIGMERECQLIDDTLAKVKENK